MIKIYKIFDKVAGELVSACTKEAIYEALFDRIEMYGTTAYIHRELTENVEDYIIIIERA